MTHNTRESAKKVLKEYYGYKSEQDVPDGLAAVLEDWLHHQLQKAREEERERIITILDDYEIDGEWQRNEMLRKIIADIAEINYTDLGKSSL